MFLWMAPLIKFVFVTLEKARLLLNYYGFTFVVFIWLVMFVNISIAIFINLIFVQKYDIYI